jgi:hypothetical protein
MLSLTQEMVALQNRGKKVYLKPITHLTRSISKKLTVIINAVTIESMMSPHRPARMIRLRSQSFAGQVT